MSDQPTLSEALAQAQARAASLIDTPAPPAPEGATVALLRTVALAHGIASDGVERSFLQGGPLADLVRAILGNEATPPPKLRGRPQELAKSWDTFARVVLLMRHGLTQEGAIARVAVDLRLKEPTVRSRFTRTRDEDGVPPETVPDTLISAYFSDPRPARRNAKR